MFSSKDIDPEISTVLRWHLDHCPYCFQRKSMPHVFGTRSRNFCSEYWEIVAEYSEYEKDYAQKGNP